MKKVIAATAIAVFSIGGIAFAQFFGQAQKPVCQAPNVFSCTKDHLGLVAAECVNPNTNAIVSKYLYGPSDVTALVNQEAQEDVLVNQVANAS